MRERSVSIAQARADLPGLIREAEDGTAVEITRRGRPVAVLVSTTAYQKLSSGSPAFGRALDDFLDQVDLEGLGLERDEFVGLRDRAPGREARW